MGNEKISIETVVNKPIDQVWTLWTLPQHIMAWNNASADWYTPSAENDLRVGGAFNYKMAARDGSFRFDFGGIYDEVICGEKIAYTLGDGRKVVVEFAAVGEGIKILETFEIEESNSLEMQKAGWQAILDNFRHYAEMS
ncbi:SRPBCC family protein [Clostridium sp.]|uniref:SRPBCC family protein n=1 Tax=Clostridium sp. TaxID=1506 RepID=UPI003216A8A1